VKRGRKSRRRSLSVSDPENAARALTALREWSIGCSTSRLGHGGVREAATGIVDLVFRVWLEPDAALNRFVRFVNSYGTRGLLFENHARYPKVAGALVRLFDASEFYSEVVIRRPQLIEKYRGKTLDYGSRKHSSLRTSGTTMKLCPRRWKEFASTGKVRAFVSCCRISWGLLPRKFFSSKMTCLGEACLEYCCLQLDRPDEITVLALGKFGGRELLMAPTWMSFLRKRCQRRRAFDSQ